MPRIHQAPETRESLILRLRGGDDIAAWQEFVEIYAPAIRATARRRGMQAADADDVTQEVLTRVARSIDTFDPRRSDGSFRAWLATITRNLAVQSFRQRKANPATGREEQLRAVPVDADFDLEGERQLFQWAARRIRPRFESRTWQAFWRTAVDGLPVETVARELDTTRAQVYVARSRVMRLLKDTIERTQFDSFDGTHSRS